MNLEFIIPDLHVFCDIGQLSQIAPPRLDDIHHYWLESSGIEEWDLSWVKRSADTLSKWPEYPSWDTCIRFKNTRDALMWKLRWS